METWFKDAKQLGSLEIETCFLLQDDLYYGPDTHPEVVERKQTEPLVPPSINRHVHSMVRTAEVEDNVDELARYYTDIIRLGRKHRLPFNHISHYFWMRFWIWNTDEDVHISFPWYDTQAEIDSFIDSVATTSVGPLFWDADQGWELEIHASDDDLYLRLRDPDYDETHAVVCFPADALLNELPRLQSRTRLIIDSLSSIVGRDLWTKRVDWPTFLDDGH